MEIIIIEISFKLLEEIIINMTLIRVNIIKINDSLSVSIKLFIINNCIFVYFTIINNSIVDNKIVSFVIFL